LVFASRTLDWLPPNPSSRNFVSLRGREKLEIVLSAPIQGWVGGKGNSASRAQRVPFGYFQTDTAKNQNYMNLDIQASKNIESGEKEPEPLATIFIVRHGESLSKEQLDNPEVENDLTEDGVRQVQSLAARINSRLKGGEKVYVMKSPRVRAQNTAKLLKDELSQANHKVAELGKGRSSLDKIKDINSQGEEVLYVDGAKEKYLSEIAEIVARKNPDYYTELRAGKTENLVSEPIDKYREKVTSVIKRLVEIARKKAGENEILILSTHGEWLDTVLEQYFSKKITKETQVKPASEIELQVFQDKIVFIYGDEKAEVNV